MKINSKNSNTNNEEKRLHKKESSNKKQRCEGIAICKQQTGRKGQRDSNAIAIPIQQAVHLHKKNTKEIKIAILSADHHTKKQKSSGKSMNESGVLVDKSIEKNDVKSQSKRQSKKQSSLVVEQSNKERKASNIANKSISIQKNEDFVVERKQHRESKKRKNDIVFNNPIHTTNPIHPNAKPIPSCTSYQIASIEKTEQSKETSQKEIKLRSF